MDIVVSHCDDEIIFGWPVIEKADRIIALSTPRPNSRKALQEVGKMMGIETLIFDRQPNFYKDKDIQLPKLAETVFTHNSWGEYGHKDHQLVNKLVLNTDSKVLVNDICINVEYETKGLKPVWQGEKVSEHRINKRLFERCKAIYDKNNAWTWSRGTPGRSSLYIADRKQRSTRGAVTKGLGDTSRQLPEYNEVVSKHLGYEPYPGSLNIWMDNPILLRGEGIQVYTDKHGTYRFWPCKINEINGHIMRPPGGFNRPQDAEIIAPIGLRELFNLKDGDKVQVEVL